MSTVKPLLLVVALVSLLGITVTATVVTVSNEAEQTTLFDADDTSPTLSYSVNDVHTEGDSRVVVDVVVTNTAGEPHEARVTVGLTDAEGDVITTKTSTTGTIDATGGTYAGTFRFEADGLPERYNDVAVAVERSTT